MASKTAEAATKASQSSMVEINHFEPAVASRLFESIRLLARGSQLFADKCISGIEARPERALELLMNSPALATVMVSELGYAKVSAIVKQAEKEGVSFVSKMVEMGRMDREQVLDLLKKSVQPVV